MLAKSCIPDLRRLNTASVTRSTSMHSTWMNSASLLQATHFLAIISSVRLRSMTVITWFPATRASGQSFPPCFPVRLSIFLWARLSWSRPPAISTTFSTRSVSFTVMIMRANWPALSPRSGTRSARCISTCWMQKTRSRLMAGCALSRQSSSMFRPFSRAAGAMSSG